MSTPARLPAPPAGPPREDHFVHLHGVSWEDYERVLAMRGDRSGPRIAYLDGVLEIMSPSKRHETEKTLLARLLELFCLERDIPLYGYGSTTFRREDAERGLEPDECYSRDADKPVPDLAIEVVVTRGSLDKLEVYRGLGISEVWVYEDGAWSLFGLGTDGRYAAIEGSRVLPEVDLERLAHYARFSDQHAALRAFRDELRRGA